MVSNTAFAANAPITNVLRPTEQNPELIMEMPDEVCGTVKIFSYYDSKGNLVFEQFNGNKRYKKNTLSANNPHMIQSITYDSMSGAEIHQEQIDATKIPQIQAVEPGAMRAGERNLPVSQ